jgi:tetraacyldisaccharide 4'-kinase
MSHSSFPRKLLLPFVPAYRLALWLRGKRLGTPAEPVRRLKYPVVSIGNLSTGGTGKTPLCIALANALTARGYDADILSRGYGRTDRGSARVDPSGTADKFGDEPLLIARTTGLPVYVASDRSAAGQLAEGDAATLAVLTGKTSPLIHLLDDGFQHRRLSRDVDILLIDERDITDSLLPAGNLREPLGAIRRASIVAIPANDTGLELKLRALGFTGPIWRIRRRMRVPAVTGPVVAFCGIARPGQFFAGVEAQGLKLLTRKAFRDHHAYTARDVESLLAKAQSVQATALITTEKDLTRLGRLADTIPASMPLLAAGLETEIEDEDRAIPDLLHRLKLSDADRSL